MVSDERTPMQDQAALGEFWDALMQGAAKAPAHRLDPAFVDTIQRVLALDDSRAPDPEFVQRLERELIGGRDAAWQELAGSQPRLTGVPNGRLGAEVSSLAAPRPLPPGRPWLATLATAALVLLVLAGSFLVFGGPLRDTAEERPANVPALDTTPDASPLPSIAADEVLMQATVETIPHSATWQGIDRTTVDPGVHWTLPNSKNNGEGPDLFYVESGALTVNADGPISITRAVEARATTVPAGSDVVLQAGDQGFIPSGVPSRWRNDGQVPAVITNAAITTLGGADDTPGVTNDSLVSLIVTPPQTPAAVTVRRVRLTASSVLPIDAVPGLTMAYVESGQVDIVDPHAVTPTPMPASHSQTRPVMDGGYGLLSFPAGHVFMSTGSKPATVLLMTITPASPGKEAPIG